MTGPGELRRRRTNLHEQLTGSRSRGRAAGAAADAQGIVRPCTRADARADERKRQGDRSPCGVVEFGGLLWGEGFLQGLCRVFFRNIEDHHVLVQKRAENTSSLHGSA